jgi:ABC-type antimicrobial peptide transport system permease subunit
MDDVSWEFILLTAGVSVLCALLIGIGVAMIYKMSKMSPNKEPLLGY